MVASYLGREDIVELIMLKGASVLLRNDEGMSAIMLAEDYGHYDVAHKIIHITSLLQKLKDPFSGSPGAC